jgi:hypothetical protein
MHLPIGLSALSVVHETAILNIFVAGLTTFSSMQVAALQARFQT